MKQRLFTHSSALAHTQQTSAPLYAKVRGYALQPAQRNDPMYPDFGFEGMRCLEGSNCFNSSQFRLDLSSALNASTSANNIRVVNARNCLGDWTSEGGGVDGAVKTFCGPFPGLALNAASLSCVQASTGGQTFWTLAAPYIGRTVRETCHRMRNTKHETRNTKHETRTTCLWVPFTTKADGVLWSAFALSVAARRECRIC